MMGSTHATTGALAGVAVAGLSGAGPAQTAAGAVLCAGAALVSDLDHSNSCATLSHGPVTKTISKVLVGASKISYRNTRTPWEKAHRPKHDPGGHRYLTHTAVFAGLSGIMTIGLSTLWPFRAVIVFLMISFALRGFCQALPGSNKIDRWPQRTAVSIIGTWFFLPVPPIFLGAIITTGIMTHIAADSMTKAGTPVLWPIEVRGQRWCRMRTPVTITTGKSRSEAVISWGSMIMTVILTATAV